MAFKSLIFSQTNFICLILLLVLKLALSNNNNNDDEEKYENSANICTTRCECVRTINNQTLTMNCDNRDIRHSLSNWPIHNDTIIATFSYNNITTLGTLPFSRATIEVVFSHCNIKYLTPGLFENVQNIEFVDFSYNLLTSEELSTDKFKGPYNISEFEPIALKHLNLAYNQIHSLSKNLFNHMPHLKSLNLEGNHLRVLDIQTQLALSSITELERLNLANNQLTELVDNAIGSLKNLIELNLAKNNMDFVPESLTLVGRTLEKLNLDGNPIIEINDNSYLGLDNIIELSTNNLTSLKYINANAFAPMVNLKILSMSNNLLLTAIDREAFGINQTLNELYLNNNHLYHLDSKLLQWSQLQVCEFYNNPLDCSCDLLNITSQLSEKIKRNRDGPRCFDSRNSRSFSIYLLTKNTCSAKPYFIKGRIRFISHHFTILRILMIILSIVVMLACSIASCLAFTRFRKFQRNRNYPFASQVLYNPLSTNIRY